MEKLAMKREPNLSRNFWRDKRVLLTGHTGFKGGWLAIWLQRLGAVVTGIGLEPNTTPSLFQLAHINDGINSHICDIRDASKLTSILKTAQPEVIFHLAAQPLVRASYLEPLGTYATNVMGTAHLLEAMRSLASLRVAVMVTTDKVYRNHEHCFPYREDDALGGHDPYSASKAASEIVIASYRDAYLAHQGVSVATARAGNIIGGGDWSQDRLIPDAVRAWSTGRPLVVRSPQAIRPWQHVLEPLNGYLTLAQSLWDQPALAGAYNFGPNTNEAGTVELVIKLASSAFGSGVTKYENNSKNPHEAGWLTLEVAKARAVLGVNPKWHLAETVQRTMAWYQALQRGVNARDLCEIEIAHYEAV